MSKEKLTHFDTFSGFGGFSLALQRVYEELHSRPTGQEEQEINTDVNLSDTPSTDSREFTTIGFSEIDKYASAVLKRHWPNTKNYGDIKSIKEEELPDFDLLTFGFPCQTFSIAGKRAGFEDLRGQLIYEVIRILRVKKPKYFIGENVKGLLSHNQGQTLEIILEELCESGYAIDFDILNAKNFSVSQNRERVFIIGKRLDTLKPEEII